MDGVADAQKRYPPHPPGRGTSTAGTINPGLNNYAPHPVDFDVSVEVTEAAGGKAGIRVAALGVELGTGGTEAAKRSTTANRIKFSVPVMFAFGREEPKR